MTPSTMDVLSQVTILPLYMLAPEISVTLWLTFMHFFVIISGTSNRESDTSVNHAGIFSLAATNDLIGNRVANSFNGMLIQAGGIGRGSAYGKVCTSDAQLGRIEGNTFHGHKRFGTYALGSNYPKVTDQSVDTNGYNIDQSQCRGFDSQGQTRGFPAAILNNLDYGNVFVGHYNA